MDHCIVDTGSATSCARWTQIDRRHYQLPVWTLNIRTSAAFTALSRALGPRPTPRTRRSSREYANGCTEVCCLGVCKRAAGLAAACCGCCCCDGVATRPCWARRLWVSFFFSSICFFVDSKSCCMSWAELDKEASSNSVDRSFFFLGGSTSLASASLLNISSIARFFGAITSDVDKNLEDFIYMVISSRYIMSKRGLNNNDWGLYDKRGLNNNEVSMIREGSTIMRSLWDKRGLNNNEVSMG